jgi:hypothetical protein
MLTQKQVDETVQRGRAAFIPNVKKADMKDLAHGASAHAFQCSANAMGGATEAQHGSAVSAHEHAADAFRKAGKKDVADLHEKIADHHRAQMENPPLDNDGDDDDKS